MKRVFAIFLLFVFLLNVLGYYGVLMGLKLKHIQNLLAQFDDDDYARDHEVTIKVPIAIPYATDSREYTRVNGEFEYQGEVYRMVKQKLQSDTLFIVCVKDFKSKALKQKLADYVKSFTDKPSGEKNQAKGLQNLIKDFMATSTVLQSTNMGWNYQLLSGCILNVFQSVSIPITSPPPQA
ncbi:MAG: hypothetical protein KF725_16430 [Cyclobacteriaceae bacterium]|nr:hypothetical protein [Cyclobacteriaceae bacterium]UYN87166.1 MAG: hypothetical protein KIT51_02495 [Cyclobacteriaceae bacterium]